jgi:uncharacterized LabA/DUF88 family protein
MLRTGCYIDGFNLYHAVDMLGDPTLKWLNLHKLAESLVRAADHLVFTKYFTALSTWSKEKRARHVSFIDAQEFHGVEVHKLGFKRVEKHCLRFGSRCKFYEEKQTDVDLATSVIDDAYQGKVDKIILVTADSDQIPTLKLLRLRFPEIEITVAAPPERKEVARELMSFGHHKVEIHANRLRACLLPRNVVDGKGRIVAASPADYVGR